MTDTVRVPAQVVVIFGGRSEIGLEVAERLAAENTVVLAARRADQLTEAAARVSAAGAVAVDCVEFDADRLDGHQAVIDAILARHGAIDVAVVAFGVLGDQARAETDADHAVAVVHTDYVAHIALLTRLAAQLRGAGRGAIMVFTSIAGWRVRRANYVYGSAKAGLDGFCSGLADSLHGSGVQLLIVRPGFVIGRMSEGMDPAPLSSTPDQVARVAVKALRSGRRSVWVPWALGPLAAVFRMLPQWIWRRMPR